MKIQRQRVLIVLLIALIFSGCAGKALYKARTDFVDSSVMTARLDIPFQWAWIKRGVDWKQYTDLYVAEVNTSYLAIADDWWQEAARYGKIEEDVAEIAGFTRRAFIEAFQKDRNRRFRIVQHPSEYGVVLELAITEVTPNKPLLKAAGITARIANQSNKSTVSFEARVRDGRTNEVIAMFADREAEKSSLINIKHATWYSHVHSIVKEWAKQCVAIANKRPREIIKDSSGFDLKPW